MTIPWVKNVAIDGLYHLHIPCVDDILGIARLVGHMYQLLLSQCSLSSWSLEELDCAPSVVCGVGDARF